MKEQTAAGFIKQVIGGTPAEVITKLLLAALAALWSYISSAGPVLLGYFVLILADVVMGATLSAQKGEKFSFTHFLRGPAKKLAMTALLFISAAVVDNYVPGNFILYGVSGFVVGTMFIDVGDKYGKLTGSRVVEWIRSKLGNILKVPQQ